MKAKERRKAQHRAELREEILVTARDLIQAHGYEGLTMRGLARQTGYTPMALYAYFADKQALLAALAQEGFQRLAEKLRRGNTRRRLTADPLATLRQTLLACVKHGIENPAEYRIVFMTPETRPGPRKNPEDVVRENAAFRIVLGRVEACVAAGVLPGVAFAVSALLWAGVHGATSLLITFGSFPFGDPMRYAELVVDRLLTGTQTGDAVTLQEDGAPRPQTAASGGSAASGRGATRGKLPTAVVRASVRHTPRPRRSPPRRASGKERGTAGRAGNLAMG